MVFKPSTSLNSSSAVGGPAERGRSSLASSVARAMNVDRGRVTPNVVCMRFCTERTEDRDMGTAISVSVISDSGGADG